MLCADLLADPVHLAVLHLLLPWCWMETPPYLSKHTSILLDHSLYTNLIKLVKLNFTKVQLKGKRWNPTYIHVYIKLIYTIENISILIPILCFDYQPLLLTRAISCFLLHILQPDFSTGNQASSLIWRSSYFSRTWRSMHLLLTWISRYF